MTMVHTRNYKNVSVVGAERGWYELRLKRCTDAKSCRVSQDTLNILVFKCHVQKDSDK